MSAGSLGWPRVHHRTTDSTNEQARGLAQAGAAHGTLVTAAEQTAGRGRQGRTWVAPPGRSLLMSLVLREFGSELLPLAAAVAVCEACEEAAGVECRVKWPNDVWIERRKVAGILIEGRPQAGWAVLGIGVNVGTAVDELPEELRETATSLAIASGEAPGVEEVLNRLLGGLERGLAAAPAAVLASWRARDALYGSEVRWADGSGVAAGIADTGALVVDTPTGRVELDAGEVHLLR